MCPLLAGVAFYNDQSGSSLIRMRWIGYPWNSMSRYFKIVDNGFICLLNNEWIPNLSIRNIEKCLFG